MRQEYVPEANFRPISWRSRSVIYRLWWHAAWSCRWLHTVLLEIDGISSLQKFFCRLDVIKQIVFVYCLDQLLCIAQLLFLIISCACIIAYAKHQLNCCFRLLRCMSFLIHVLNIALTFPLVARQFRYHQGCPKYAKHWFVWPVCQWSSQRFVTGMETKAKDGPVLWSCVRVELTFWL